MARRVLVLTLGLLLILCLSAFGATKTNQVAEKEIVEKSGHGYEDFVKSYLTTPEPKIFLPITGDTAGYTWYDFQHNEGQRRQIAYDASTSLTHVVWTNLVEEGGNRFVDYNAWDPVGGWLIAGGMHISPAVQRGGFACIDLLPDGREVIAFHRAKPDVGPWSTEIAVEANTPGLGEFKHFDIPDSFSGSANPPGSWPTIAISSQLRVDTAFMHITYAEPYLAGDSPKGLAYVRCFIDPTRNDTLVCQAPDIVSPMVIPVNTQLKPNKLGYKISSVRLSTAPVATSPISEKVSIIYMEDWGSGQQDNNVYYAESNNNGDDWMSAGSITFTNLTHYENTTTNVYCDLASVYDYDDELHIMWTTNKGTTENEVTFWHWSPSTDIRKVAAASDPADFNTGTWSTDFDKFILGVYPDSNYIYVTYTRFKPGDVSYGEFANGDLCVMGSTNGGLTWGPEVNMTNTNTNGCTPGNCLSEMYPSQPEIVGDSLHILYLEDKDAGRIAAPTTEGEYTNNAMRILAYPRPSIPAVASITYTPAQLNSPFRWATNGGSTSDTMTFDNTGTSTLYVTLSGPSWLTISPNTFSIAEAGAAQEVYLTFNGATFSDTILIDSLLVASNNGANGLVYSDTDLVGIHFVVTDEFYRVERDTCDYSPITQVSNMGNLGSGEFDSVGMFYKGKNYLFEFTPVFVTGDISGTGPVGFTWLHLGHNDFLPEGNISSTKYDNLGVQVFYQKAGLVFPPRRSDHHLYHSWWGYWTRYSKVIQLHPQIILVYDWWVWNAPPVWWDDLAGSTDPQGGYFGIGADWDVAPGASRHNLGGYDDVQNLIWLYSDSTGFEKLYGGFVWLRHGVDGVIDSTGGPFGAHVLNNGTQLYPDNGYDDDSLYKYMSTPGYSIEQDSAQDMNIVMSFVEVPNPTPTTVVELSYALLVSDKGEDSLKYVANKMKIAKAGDANGDGGVTVSDVVYLINALFKGGPAPWKAYADTNGDGSITVSDVVYLINALFKGGPKSKLIWCQQRPWLNWPE